MPVGRLLVRAAQDALEQLARLRHNEPEAIEIVQDFQQLGVFEGFDRVSEVTALAKRIDKVFASLGGAVVIRAGRVVRHGCLSVEDQA